MNLVEFELKICNEMVDLLKYAMKTRLLQIRLSGVCIILLIFVAYHFGEFGWINGFAIGVQAMFIFSNLLTYQSEKRELKFQYSKKEIYELIKTG